MRVVHQVACDTSAKADGARRHGGAQGGRAGKAEGARGVGGLLLTPSGVSDLDASDCSSRKLMMGNFELPSRQDSANLPVDGGGLVWRHFPLSPYDASGAACRV